MRRARTAQKSNQIMESLPITPAVPLPEIKTPYVPFMSNGFLCASHYTNGGITQNIDNIAFAISDGTFVGFHYTGSQVTRTVGHLKYTIYPPGSISGYTADVVYVVMNLTYPANVWVIYAEDRLWQ